MHKLVAVTLLSVTDLYDQVWARVYLVIGWQLACRIPLQPDGQMQVAALLHSTWSPVQGWKLELCGLAEPPETSYPTRMILANLLPATQSSCRQNQRARGGSPVLGSPRCRNWHISPFGQMGRP